MKDLYEIDYILERIYPKQDEYFLPIALYIQRQETHNIFLFHGLHITYDKWTDLGRPNNIHIKKHVPLSKQYLMLWDIDIISKHGYLFSKKISGQGYSLLLNKCIAPQVSKLKNRFIKFKQHKDIYKYTSIISDELLKVFSKIKKFIEANPLLSQALEKENRKLNTSKISLIQEVEDIIKPVTNIAFIAQAPKEIRVAYVEQPTKETTPVKESKITSEFEKSQLEVDLSEDTIENKLICEGATWSISYNNIPEKTVNNTIGMHIIAHLIKCQGDIIRADKIYQDVVADIKPEC